MPESPEPPSVGGEVETLPGSLERPTSHVCLQVRRPDARSRAAVLSAIARDGLSHTFEVRPGVAVSLRRCIVDFVEEYGRHAGHAGLVRETIDGRTGEDPPGKAFPYVLP